MKNHILYKYIDLCFYDWAINLEFNIGMVNHVKKQIPSNE